MEQGVGGAARPETPPPWRADAPSPRDVMRSAPWAGLCPDLFLGAHLADWVRVPRDGGLGLQRMAFGGHTVQHVTVRLTALCCASMGERRQGLALLRTELLPSGRNRIARRVPGVGETHCLSPSRSPASGGCLPGRASLEPLGKDPRHVIPGASPAANSRAGKEGPGPAGRPAKDLLRGPPPWGLQPRVTPWGRDLLFLPSKPGPVFLSDIFQFV